MSKEKEEIILLEPIIEEEEIINLEEDSSIVGSNICSSSCG